MSGWSVTESIGPVTRTDIVRYAGASGDLNPIHHDEDYARTAGVGGVFAMGMYPAGVVARVVADAFGAGNIRSFRARFDERVWPGDVLTIEGREAGSGGELSELEFVVLRNGGSRAVRCWATVHVARPARPTPTESDQSVPEGVTHV